MKLLFGAAGGRPARACELCLQPMRFLGEHAECQLFRCDDCALVSSEAMQANSLLEKTPPTMWREISRNAAN